MEIVLIFNLLFGVCLILGNLWFGAECSFPIKSYIYLFSRIKKLNVDAQHCIPIVQVDILSLLFV